MIHGLDTGFLVAAELREHAADADARATLAQLTCVALGVASRIPECVGSFTRVAVPRGVHGKGFS